MRPDEAIASLPALAGARPVRVLRRTALGEVWRLSSPSGDRLLKIRSAAAIALGLDSGRELQVLRALAGSGLAPEPVAADADRGLLVTAFVPGLILGPLGACPAAALLAVGARVAQLHRVPVPAGLAPLDLHGVVERYAGLAGASPAPALEALARLPASAPRCLCHNDLHGGNLLRGPGEELVLLDWEYAGLADPLFDLAVLAEFDSLPTAGLRALLDGYRRAGGIAPPDADLRHHRALYRELAGLWQAALDALAGGAGRPAGPGA